MRRSGGVLVGIAVAAAGVAVAPSRAQACSCSVITPAAAFDNATAVFEGYVVGSTLDAQAWLTVQFQVARAWKGVSADTVVAIGTPADGSSCGVGVEDGWLMLVYARTLDSGELIMSLCSRTNLTSFAQEDFDALGPPAQTGLLPPPGTLGGADGGGSTGAAGTAGADGAGGASGTTGLVRRGGCAVAPAPASGVALGLWLALAVVIRRRAR